MAGLFWDTSALVKHYHPELGTPKVDHLLQRPGSQHLISRVDSTTRAASFLTAGKAATTGAISGPVATLTEGVLKTMFVARVITVTTLLAGVTLVAAGAGVI